MIRPELHFLQRDREDAAPSPLAFEFEPRIGIVNHKEAVKLLEDALEAFEQARREEERRNRRPLFLTPGRECLTQRFSMSVSNPGLLSSEKASAEGTFLKLETGADVEGIETGEVRFIETQDGRRFRGEVWEVGTGIIVLNCPSANLKDVPQKGVAKLDLYALQVAVERQHDAINRIRNATSAQSRLKELILTPGAASTPGLDAELSPEVVKMLDSSQRQGLQAALGSADLLLVQGPPGTGKTHFIVAFVLEELRRTRRRESCCHRRHTSRSTMRLSVWVNTCPKVAFSELRERVLVLLGSRQSLF